MSSAGQVPAVIGFIGLGQMGGPMATNLAAHLQEHGNTLLCFDKAGTAQRLPAGAKEAASVHALAAAADTIFLSLPDGAVSEVVAGQIAEAPDRRTTLVVDLSTIGPSTARAIDAELRAKQVAYADAPVSGGRSGAVAATISLMWSGSRQAFDAHRSLLAAMAANVFYVGETPGQGQALKLLNNFLSATAMAATAEAIHFGQSQGLPMQTMLDVLNVSSGQNTATKDKYPRRVMTETFDAGFTTGLMAKDVALFMSHVRQESTPGDIGGLVEGIWQSCEQSLGAESDFTRIYQFIGDKSGSN